MNLPELTIDVTENDINNGAKGGGKCPITLAARRILPDEDVWTGRHHLWIGVHPYRMLYILPLEACQFIDDFDASKSVKPFSFTTVRAWRV